MTDTDGTHEAGLPLRAIWFRRPEPLEGPVVVTGVFDVLHVGHVRFLTSIAERGLPLVVGIESDERVRAWKGPGRPINPAEERAETIAALSCVSGSFIIEGSPSVADWAAYADLLRPLSPAALAFTAGDRYTQAKIRGAEALGAQAWELPFTPGRSTTAALGRLAHSL
ncbi:adenylyltransferase/cytidyltransferase family protein [Nocardiopsis alba]|uniref:Cytidyltransferase-like domain protein n=1 Tax=Nocardiopsis alba (strain ATCC BAA-2165 / BE74) TaxID=1205910 RepID=J7LAH9_NOCAA|nr:adenylyltransferase/cytidyltransferase family protein [Nocardiopsis alba]AFR10648.1 cytidyltransferase-like domain protein [Nocardiopsis alba ATCC BAA-2165]